MLTAGQLRINSPTETKQQLGEYSVHNFERDGEFILWRPKPDILNNSCDKDLGLKPEVPEPFWSIPQTRQLGDRFTRPIHESEEKMMTKHRELRVSKSSKQGK